MSFPPTTTGPDTLRQPPILVRPFDRLTIAEYHRIVRAREAVFHLEQHITCPDADAVDPQSVFLWTEQENRVVAFLRIIPAGVVCDEISVGRVLVDAACRRRGLCRRMMLEALRYIDGTWGPSPVRISAQRYLVGFYASLGFEAVSEPYDEAGISHVKMLRRP